MSDSIIGSGWVFPPRFNSPKSGPDMVKDEALLEQAISLVLNTQVGERSLQPDLGCGLNHFVFSEATPLLLTELKEEISSAILNHEPRIKLLDIQYDLSGVYEGRVNIVLNYWVKQTNARNNMVFPFYLVEKSI